MPDNVRAVPLSTHAIRLTWSIRLPPPPPPSSPQSSHQQQSHPSDSSIATTTTSDIEIIDGFYIGYRIISTSSSSSPETSNVAGSQQSQSSSSSSTLAGINNHQSLSYTYKTISNSPIQPLYSKMSTIGNNNWKQSSSSYGGGGIRTKSTPNSFLIKLNNQSTSIEMDQTSTSMMITTSPFHQYYEHIIDTLQRQTLYQ